MSIYFNLVADLMPNTNSSESTHDGPSTPKGVVVQADVHAGPLVLSNKMTGESTYITEN